ncbi:MAG: TonB-dependent receptor [Prolixibacteraceae bacterium]
MKNNFLKLCLTLVMFASMFASVVAQVTSSGISGRITGGNESLPGAAVVAVHVPSGTQYGTVTNADGRFSLQGMRTGGPYKVDVSFVGYAKASFTDITLSLGESFVLNTSLKESNATVGEVTVVGQKPSPYNSEKNGASMNLSTRQITMMPSVSRSINDVTRLTPQSNGNQIGGGNYRQNYITVDGAQFNNAFGIGTNLPGGGSPISLDAIDQISVNITPFDVRQSGFIGASVNAVTRSGSNEFSGSVYDFMSSEKYKGNKVGDATFTKNPSDYKMFGFRLGGPIIKNKLFFFVNYESEKNTVPGPSRVAATPSAPADGVNIARPTASDMDMISKYLLDTYGYETGPYQGYSNQSPASKLLARVDWNISRNHKFNIRYSQTKAKSPSYPSTSTSPFPTIYTNNRQSMDAMWYQNSGYFTETNFSSLSAELNSTLLNGKLLNTLRYTNSFQDEPRSTNGKLFPFVDILSGGKPYVSFGTELFSYGNLRQVKTTTITDDVTWSMGKNNFTAGLQYEANETKNGFMRFGTSFYVFNSWSDFTNGVKPADFGITFSNTPGYAQAFPSFKFGQYSAYIQDEITVNSKLKLVAGLRADLPTFSQPALAHPKIENLTFGGNSYSTATLPQSKVMLSPRVGFNYNLKEDRSLVLRGGTGIFTGRVPFVWVVSQVGDAGMVQTTMTYTSATLPANVTKFSDKIDAYYPTTQPAVGEIIPSTFTIISKDFKMPQSWKSSLALDAKLPFGIKGSLEGIYNKDINTAFFVNEGLKGGVAMNIAGYPDNRIVYPVTAAATKGLAYYQTISTDGKTVTTPAGTGGNGVSPIVLENRNKGYYYSLTAKLEKAFAKGFTGMVAYTRSDARNLVDGSGDQASSAWNGNANVNGANSEELSYASYVVPDRLIASASYKFEYLKSMATTVSVFYEGSSQGRFSYVYSSNIVRDGAGSNNLIYVPKNASEITFVDQTVKDASGANVLWTAAAQSTSFFNFIDQDKYLRTRMGKYAERNGALIPWRNSFDAKLMQEIFVKVGGKRNTIQVSLDILNVGNLINSNWGKADFYNQNNILKPVNNSSVVAGGTVKPTFQLNPYNSNQMLQNTYRDNLGYGSTYSMQLGIRYIFN